MKPLLLSTAIIALTSFGALAQTETAPVIENETAPMMQDETAPADPMAPLDSTVDAAPAPLMGAPEGYAQVQATDRTADDLTGARVYDAEQDNIGRVTDLVLEADNSVSHVIVDVGGFLGFGTHTVALPIDDVEIFAHTEQDDLRLHVSLTRDQLEAMPEYEEG